LILCKDVILLVHGALILVVHRSCVLLLLLGRENRLIASIENVRIVSLPSGGVGIDIVPVAVLVLVCYRGSH
jgi:hypothetical protein